jgi:hypothetical protein
LLNEYTQALQKAGLRLKRVLGPLENVINYAPMTQSEIQSLIAFSLKRYTGKVLAAKLASFRLFQQLYGRAVSIRSDIPGRHYSFLAVKS